MKRILFVVQPVKGHLNPVIGIAKRLVEWGHSVRFLCIQRAAPELQRLGFDVVEPPGAPPSKGTKAEAILKMCSDPEEYERAFRSARIECAPAQVDALRSLITDFGPDVVALDGLLYASVIATELEGIPYASLSAGLRMFDEVADLDCDYTRVTAALRPAADALFASYKLSVERRTVECVSPYLNTMFTTPEFVGRDARTPPHTFLVGPSISWERGDLVAPRSTAPVPEQVVLISFGSVFFWQPELLSAIAKGTEPLGLRAIVSAGNRVEVAPPRPRIFPE